MNISSRTKPLRAVVAILVALYTFTFLGPVKMAAASSCVAPPSGLVSWWKGERNAADTIRGNNGQITGAITFAPGKVGQAFAFDGVDGIITAPASPTLNVGVGGGFTIETWIKPSTIELERPIAEWNSVTGGNPYPYGVHFWISVPEGYGAGPGCLYANLVDTAGNFHWLTSAGGLINTNSFQHVAVTYDQSSGMAVLLLNGMVVARQHLGSFTPQTSYNLYLGGRPGGSAAAYRWAGLMDEVSLYARALGQSEIQAIYAAESAGKCLTPAGVSSLLLNVDFGAGRTGSAKTGFAALGRTPDDFWNFYTRDDEAGHWRTFGSLSNLKTADGRVTGAGLTVANAPGAWGNGSTDPMYVGYIYPFDGGNVTVTVTNLPAGQYDVLAYASDGNFEVLSAGVSRGVQHTLEPTPANPPVWTQGVQYARFTNVTVSVGQPIILTVRPGLYGYAVISGMQIVALNQTPSALAQTVRLNEDESMSITLAGTDPDDDRLTYTLVSGSANGTLTGTAPNLIYRPIPNYHGPDAFSFKVNDGRLDSSSATVSLDVASINDPPVADARGTRLLIISANHSNAPIVLDGARSSDVEGDPLQYHWFDTGAATPAANGIVAVLTRPVGTNALTLVVDDGRDTNSQNFFVEIITTAQAVERLVARVNDQVPGRRLLIAHLRLAISAIHRGKPAAAIHQLRTFQKKVQAKVSPLDQALAKQFIQAAQEVIDLLNAGRSKEARPKADLSRQANGRARLQFTATRDRIYIIEASSNLVDWEKIGVAAEGGPGEFEFEDTTAARMATRYYRIVVP